MVELIPHALLIAGFVPPINQNLPGVPKVGTKQLTALYGDLADEYGYRSFTISPGGEGCEMIGATPANALIIQPPSVQLVQDLAASLSTDVAADRASGIFREVLQTLRLPMFGLGVRIVYRCPLQGGDSRPFTLRHFFGAGGVDLMTLGQPEGQPVWAGVKFVVNPVVTPGSTYTVTIEPSNADTSMLYLDVDAQLQTSLDPGALKSQVQTVDLYVKNNVAPLLTEG